MWRNNKKTNVHINRKINKYSFQMDAQQVCDTIRPARLAMLFDDPQPLPQPQPFNPPHMPNSLPRKLCVRHQRMADEGTNLKLQQVRLHWTISSYHIAQNLLSTVAKCPPLRGTRISQCHLVQLFILISSPTCTHLARPPYHVLLFPTLSSNRTACPSHPHRSFCRLTTRSFS